MSWFAGVCLALAGTLSAAEPAPPAGSLQSRKFFVDHCYDCHIGRDAKGGLDLESLSADMASPPLVDRWTTIYDRIDRGEMPPADAPRPQPDEVQATLAAIKPTLHAADRARREVVQRRLNREEYQNTIHDLLVVDVDLKKLLPEDQQAGGFDNNGEALAISTELMERYLETAETAIDAAIVHGPRPEQSTFTVDMRDELSPDDRRAFGIVDGRTVTYTSDRGDYSKIATRIKRLPRPGRYRFKFEAATHRAQQPLVFTVVASNFANIGAITTNLGFYDAVAEPKTFTIEATLDKGFAIQFFAFGLPGWLKDPLAGDHPGVGFGPVEITGPLNDSWPPESHTRLLGSVDPSTIAAEDVAAILARFLPRAFRRPVTEDELRPYVSLVANRRTAGATPEASLRAGLVAALCSPNFLYLREKSPAQPKAASPRISDIELASRLSYFLWSSLPDAELLSLAEQNKLHEADALRGQVERLLRDPKNQRFATNYLGQWLKLRQIDATTPDPKLYPEFDELIKVSMLAEADSFFRHVLENDLSIDNFLDSDFAMLNQTLARHYGIDGVLGHDMRKVSLPPDSVRGGLLTQAALLKVTANGTNTSPVTRGVWVQENILGRRTPPPPANVASIEPDIRGATTIREQLQKHRDVESCSVCHRHIDPPGFALESFDPVGRHRQAYLQFIVKPEFAEQGWGHLQDGPKVDPTGRLASGEEFTDIRDFKKLLLKQRDQFARCLTEKLITYALGRELGFSDRGAVQSVVQENAAKGNGLRSLVHAIVQSPAFVTR